MVVRETYVVRRNLGVPPDRRDRDVLATLQIGQLDLLARANACRERLVVRLVEEPPDRVVCVAVSGPEIAWGLDDFVAARILELVVHFDDLAASVDVGEFRLPSAAVALTCHLGIDIAMRRHGPTSVMRALYRSDRNTRDALRPL